jgi:hypothetical protein
MAAVNLVLMVTYLFTACIVGLLALPLARGKVGMNRWYGFRFKRAFESAENWERINRYGGRHMLVCSVVLGLFALAIAAFPLDADGGLGLLAASSAPLVLVIPAITTWRYSRTL